jgi:hypothetical protein
MRKGSIDGNNEITNKFIIDNGKKCNVYFLNGKRLTYEDFKKFKYVNVLSDKDLSKYLKKHKRKSASSVKLKIIYKKVTSKREMQSVYKNKRYSTFIKGEKNIKSLDRIIEKYIKDIANKNNIQDIYCYQDLDLAYNYHIKFPCCLYVVEGIDNTINKWCWRLAFIVIDWINMCLLIEYSGMFLRWKHENNNKK